MYNKKGLTTTQAQKNIFKTADYNKAEQVRAVLDKHIVGQSADALALKAVKNSPYVRDMHRAISKIDRIIRGY